MAELTRSAKIQLAGVEAARKVTESTTQKNLAQAQRLEDFTRQATQTGIQQGNAAFTALGDLLGLARADGTIPSSTDTLRALESSPQFQFRLAQGLRATERAAAQGGTLFSGNQLLAAQGFGQQAASQEFDNRVAQLLSTAQLGQGAAAAGIGGLSQALASSQSARQFAAENIANARLYEARILANPYNIEQGFSLGRLAGSTALSTGSRLANELGTVSANVRAANRSRQTNGGR